MAVDGLGDHKIVIVGDDSHYGPVSSVKETAAMSGTVRLIELGANYGRRFAGQGNRRGMW